MRIDPFALPNQTARLGRYRAGALRAVARLVEMNFRRRLWQRDASLWSSEAAMQGKISNRLGWLTSPESFGAESARIEQFVRGLRQAGFRHAILLGMGGSSMCPEVCRTTFGVARGYLDLLVLDTTDPATIRAREQAVDLRRTLFIVSSKSGTTTETASLYKYFYDRVRAEKGDAAGENFIAITDAGTPLAQQAAGRRFRDCFLNPADIGGRFSALSFFGLVPAALVGVDIRAFLGRAQAMLRACGPEVSAAQNPGLVLGALLASLYAQGRDKFTFVLDPPIASFGFWVEQLVAESLGKIGKGIVPVEGERLGPARVYDRDRVFARLTLARRPDATGRRLEALVEAGHPLIEIRLRDTLDLAGELYRWEIATAAAGALMELNPFDEPNVQESKNNTDRLLSKFRATGRLPEQSPLLAEARLRVFVPESLAPKLAVPAGRGRSSQLLARFLGLVRRGDYLGLIAYFESTREHERSLQAMRVRLRDHLRRAITVGYGPRFLHSTGQLHKGGPNNGLYLQLVVTDAADLPVPDEPYSFSTLKQAQALGDFAALKAKQRRVLRIHLGEEIAGGLRALARLLDRVLAPAFRPKRRARKKRR